MVNGSSRSTAVTAAWSAACTRASSLARSRCRSVLNPSFQASTSAPSCPAVWYRREVTIPAEWVEKRVLLHFQAVDYDTTVWIDGVEVVRHRGGFTPFSAEVPGATAGATITIVVLAA